MNEMFEQNRLFGLAPINYAKEKQCDYCYRYLTRDQFDKDPYQPDGLDHRCKRCKGIEARSRKYNMAEEAYIQMAREQEGHCAICGADDQKLVIDHDHQSNAVRGLLCSNCNSGLGMFKDSPRRLRAALAYLEKVLTSDSL